MPDSGGVVCIGRVPYLCAGDFECHQRVLFARAANYAAVAFALIGAFTVAIRVAITILFICSYECGLFVQCSSPR